MALQFTYFCNAHYVKKFLNRYLSAGLERERWQQDIKRAHEIQMGMLPAEDLITNTFEISGFCQPAADVGGDYYDYQILNKDQVGIIIGDVTGHGFYSGLFVAMAKTCLHLQARIEDRPNQVMAAMNRTVSLSMQNDMLMTCCYVRIDPQLQKLIYCNAGHNYPYHYNRQTDALEPLESTDPLLGIPSFESLPFHQEEKSCTQGDLLILYSDGVTEAQNSQADMFEEDRLKKVILKNKKASAVAVKEAILKAHAHHCQGTPQEDDVTLVVIRAI